MTNNTKAPTAYAKKKPMANHNFRLNEKHDAKLALLASRYEVAEVDVIRFLIEEATVPPAKNKAAKKGG